MTKFGLVLSTLSALALVGCGGDGRGGGGGGGIMLMDGGPDTGSGGGSDSGTGTDAGGGGTDSGGGTRECESMWMSFPAEAAPRCSAETKTCIEACTDAMCVSGCIDADTTMPLMQDGLTIDCGFCISYQQFYCLDSMGCHDQVAGYFCCIEDNGCMDQACVQANCSTQVNALQMCAQTTATACAGLPTTGPYAVCFP